MWSKLFEYNRMSYNIQRHICTRVIFRCVSESGSDTIGTHKALRSQIRQVWHDRHMFVNDMHRLRNAYLINSCFLRT